ncbi:MAG TPA: hypothetical protein H9751_11395 [Candidatus Corynebacterium faecigallinarum]|uniref:Secreted protein n=1 Tax=Candidatus Corynebacterium faecigallinarum TaxID=2838528 RepID=A0A9D2QHD7_9CORY|nr:hypothetical protein [Candidatus Corynebacterium faecigallinarum]
MRRTRRPATVTTAAAAVAVALGLGLTSCSSDSDSTVEDDHVNAALSSSDAASESDAPDPTLGDSAPAPAPATQQEQSEQPDQDQEQEATQVELGDYTVTMGDGTALTCMFREDQEADGFDWGCQANVETEWPATRGGDANGVAYRKGGDPELYALLGNAAGVDLVGELEPGTVTRVGDRFVVDLTEDGAALISADGVTARLTQQDYSLL